MELNVCRKNKYGYCKYGDRCQFKHVKQICNDSNCNVFACDKRHPRNCRWFGEYGRCKFTTFCKYKHEKIKTFEELLSEIRQNEIRLRDINAKLENIEKQERDILNKYEEFEVHVEKKLLGYDTQFNTFFELLAEKDAKIVALESSLKDIQDSLQDMTKPRESVVTSTKQQFKCEFCDFQTHSANGLKTHKARKHTKYNIGTEGTKCDFCNEKFVNEKELKEHMITHSYLESSQFKFKCDECSFWGPNEHSMKMHFKRLHSETISCGMCEYQAADLETLDIHTFTCELYKCEKCDKRLYSFSDIKRHIEKEHKGYSSLRHYYRWKSNEEFFTENYHWLKDLLKNQKD